MDKIKARPPKDKVVTAFSVTSRRQLYLLFNSCVVVVIIWTLVRLFYQLPAWSLALNIWDLIGRISYVLLFALIEIVLTFGLLTAVSFILPRALFRERLAVQGMLVLLVMAALAIWAQDNVGRWADKPYLFLAGTVAVFITAVFASYLLLRQTKLEQRLLPLLDRLTVLGSLYLVLIAGGILIIIFRNLGTG